MIGLISVAINLKSEGILKVYCIRGVRLCFIILLHSCCTILLDFSGLDCIQEVNSWDEGKEKGYSIINCLKTNFPIQLRSIT